MGGFFIAMSLRQDAPKEQKAFYKSKAWQKCREEYISKVGGLCERCLRKGIVKPGYIVHHKEYISLDNIDDASVLLNHENLEYLCFDCHQREHFGQKRRYEVCVDGSVLPMQTPP